VVSVIEREALPGWAEHSQPVAFVQRARAGTSAARTVSSAVRAARRTALRPDMGAGSGSWLALPPRSADALPGGAAFFDALNGMVLKTTPEARAHTAALN
jgi:hypothetical protein